MTPYSDDEILFQTIDKLRHKIKSLQWTTCLLIFAIICCIYVHRKEHLNYGLESTLTGDTVSKSEVVKLPNASQIVLINKDDDIRGILHEVFFPVLERNNSHE